MKLQKLLSFALILSVFILNSGAGCSSKTDDPQPDNFQSLLGRWEIGVANIYVKDSQGERLLGSFRKGLAYIFYQDGGYDGCILPGSDWDNAGQSGATGVWNCSTNKPGRWSLKVTKVSGKTIEEGTLTLTAPTLKEPFILEKLHTFAPDNLTDATLSDTDVLLQGQTPVKKDAFGSESWGVYIFRKK